MHRSIGQIEMDKQQKKLAIITYFLFIAVLLSLFIISINRSNIKSVEVHSTAMVKSS